MVQTSIQRAEVGDVEAIHELLRASNLPTEGIEPTTEILLVAKNEDRVLGGCAVEIYGLQGLLRSVVVAPDVRSAGIGGLLVEEAVRESAAVGLRELWLLTLDADGYFGRFGFETVDRRTVRGPVRESDEFARLCPDSAVCMRLHLDNRTNS